MNSSERVLAAINHRTPDRIPLDLGSMYETSIVKSTYLNLRRYLNLDINKIDTFDVIQQLPEIEEDILNFLGVDIRGIYCNPSSKWSLKIEEIDSYFFFADEWGIKWYMPKENGYYYDARFHPLKEYTLEEIKKFKFPDFTDKKRYINLRRKAIDIKNRGYALVSGTGVGIMLMCSWLRGMDKFFMDMAADKKLAEYLLDKITENVCISWEYLLKEVGNLIDVAYTGDDLATQLAPFISMEMFKIMLKPRYKKIINTINMHTNAKVSFHTCGSIFSLIPELIDIGVNILNPIQVSAAGMDTKNLKKEFGNDIVFWGGGCDTQHILPRGSIEDVKAEVKKRIEDLAAGGGFVFNQVHNIQAGVSPENIMAMYNTLKENWWY
jgi:uroporphyrinogen decarboxylase